MQTRTLSDETVIQGAYANLDSASSGLGRKLKTIVQAFVNYGIRRFKRFASLFKRVDPSVAQRMDTYVDIMRGRSTLAPAEELNPGLKYHGGMSDRLKARLDDLEMEADSLERAGDKSAAARVRLRIQDLVDEVEFGDPYGPSPRADEDAGVPPKYPDDGLEEGPSGAEGTGLAGTEKRRRHFGRLMQYAPDKAWRYFTNSIVPYLDHGRTVAFDFSAKAFGEAHGWSSSEKNALTAVGYSFMMPNAKTNHTVHSKINLEVGDARYTLMPLLADLLDTQTSGSTQVTFNGRPFRSLAQVARDLLSQGTDRIVELGEELRIAIGKDENKRFAKRI